MNNDCWKSTAKSHPGSVRTVNEDAFLNEPGAGLWCVADGMGGHAKGDVASALIVEKLSALMAAPAEISLDLIKQAIEDANAEILDLSTQLGQKIGSTIAVLFIAEDMAHVLWAGDSRVYHFSDNKLTCITKDHTQAEELVIHGFLTPDQAQNHPGANLITRSVGTNRTLNLEHKTLDWKGTDKFIICTDGLYGAIDHAKIEAHLADSTSANLSELLVDCALDGWARDNVTVITVHNESKA